MLRIEGLHHTYPAAEQPVLSLGDWALAAGDQVLLRGVSGSGKTTLLNIVAGLLRPSQGAVYYGAQSIYALGEAARDRLRARIVGYVFQNHYLLPTLTALENVIMPLAFGGVRAAVRKRRALTLLEQIGLGSIAHQYPAKISTGQRLRVAIARALANQPRLLLADEPTAALDGQSSCIVMDLMQAECQAHGAVLLVASHDPALETRFPAVVDLHAGKLNA